MPFCFLTLNLAEIGHELWPEKAIFKMAVAAILNFKNFNFWSRDCNGFTISVPNFIEIGQFITKIWRFNDFQNGGRPASWILKHLQFLSCSLCRDAVLLLHTKFSWNQTIGRWVIAKKTIFKMAAAAILNFKNFNFWSRDCNIVQYLMWCTKFHQNRTIFHWDMAI